MKYLGKNISEAIYTNSEGNPFLEAMPELLSNKEFFELIKSEVVFQKIMMDGAGSKGEIF